MSDDFIDLYHDPDNVIYIQCPQELAQQMTDNHVQAALRMLQAIYPEPRRKIVRFTRNIPPEQLADVTQECVSDYFTKYPWRARPAESD